MTARIKLFARTLGAALPYILVFSSVALALYQARLWLAPKGMTLHHIVIMVAVVAVADVAALAMVRDRDRRAEASLLAAFLILWIAAWRPESRALGVFLGGGVLLVASCQAWPICALGWLGIVAAVAFTGYERNYGALDIPAVEAVFQTYSAEASAFVLQEITPTMLLLALMLLAIYTALLRRANLSSAARQRLVWIGASLLLLSLPFAALEAIGKAAVIKEAYSRLIKDQDMGPAPKLSLTRSRDRPPLDVVLMLGESTSKHFWELYGAPVESNPGVRTLKDAILFSDVVSLYSHTVPSVTGMMYRDMLDASNTQSGNTEVSLIEILHQAGVHTEWISAQPKFGKWSRPITRLADAADRSVFLKKNNATGLDNKGEEEPQDEIATAAVLSSLANGDSSSRLLVQHMLANHWPYCAYMVKGDRYRFPVSGKAWFGSADDNTAARDCYIKATRFVDLQITRVAHALQGNSKPGILIYVPDHGEDPEGATGHNSSVHVAHHVEIPLVIVFNEAAQRAFPEQFTQLQKHAASPFLNSWTFELLLDMFGIHVEGLHTEVDSIAAPSFKPRSRVLFPKDSPIRYDEALPGDRKDAMEWTRLNLKARQLAAIWKAPLYAHRVDTMAKALEAKNSFDGVEMDIVYDGAKKDFFVHHPPAPSTGLRLTDQLAALADKPNLRIWLDFKNPTAQESAPILARLEEIDRRWKIKTRSVLELPDTAHGAGMAGFAETGWSVSLYVPPSFGKCGRGGDITKEECQTEAKQILADAAVSMRAKYLSFDYAMISAISKYIEPIKGNIGLLSWNLAVSSADDSLPQELARLYPLDGLIITFPSKYNW